MALLEIDTGHPEAALPFIAEAERLDTVRGDDWAIAAGHVNRAGALLASGRLAEAANLVRELARSVGDHGDPDLTLELVELAAGTASLAGDHTRAVRLAACADEQRTLNRMPLSTPDRAFLERRLAASRRALGERLAEVERAGRELTTEDALAEAAEITVP